MRTLTHCCSKASLWSSMSLSIWRSWSLMSSLDALCLMLCGKMRSISSSMLTVALPSFSIVASH